MAYTTIDNPELYFQIKLYTGTGSSQAITLDGSEDMAPDFIWFKNRTSGQSHCLVDAVRGRKGLFSDDTTAELTFDATKDFTSFDSDGFTVGIPHQVNSLNYSTGSIGAWCWKANGTGSANTVGDMASTVSVNATAGFTIVTYDGEKNSGDTFGHGLGLVPAFMMFKNTELSGDWTAFHGKNTSAPETDYLIPNDNNATTDHNQRWWDTMPTSTLVTLGDDNGLNADGNIIVAYIWSDVQGYSKFGSYTGNGNADGSFVYLGFRPAFVMLKYTSPGNGVGSWHMYDNKRKGYNVENDYVQANTTSTENSDTDQIDLLSNGFKCRATGSDSNESGSTYVYAAFAEAPFVNSNGVPCNAR